MTEDLHGSGGQSDGILYLLFPGSGNLRPRTIGEIQSEGEKLLYHLGEMKKLSSCAESGNPAPAAESFMKAPNALDWIIAEVGP